LWKKANMNREETTSTGSAIALWIIGWVLAVGGGGVLAIAIGQADFAAATTAFGSLLSGILFIGFGSAVDRLSRIEQRLRPSKASVASRAALKPENGRPQKVALDSIAPSLAVEQQPANQLDEKRWEDWKNRRS
jgi:hypothetical protein